MHLQELYQKCMLQFRSQLSILYDRFVLQKPASTCLNECVMYTGVEYEYKSSRIEIIRAIVWVDRSNCNITAFK